MNHSTCLLVFPQAADTAPDVRAIREDRFYLEESDGGRVGYSREITPVDFTLWNKWKAGGTGGGQVIF